MYLKIVSWVPKSKNGRREQIFECSCVDVCKYSFYGKEEFNDLVNTFCGDISSLSSIWFLGGGPKYGKRMEFLLIYMTDKQGIMNTMVATDVCAYVMNEDGKTIDKWECKKETISPSMVGKILETAEYMRKKTEPLIIHGD